MQADRNLASVTIPVGSSLIVLALMLGLGGCAATHLQMGRMAERSGDYETMLAHCQDALETTPQNPDAQLCVADAQRKLGNYQAAEKAYLAYLNDRPGDVTARLALVELYLANRQTAKARFQIDQVLRYDPHQAKAYYYRGELERRRGACRPAVTAYRKALELAPGDERARTGLARTERETCAKPIRSGKKSAWKPVPKSSPPPRKPPEEPASTSPVRVPAPPPARPVDSLPQQTPPPPPAPEPAHSEAPPRAVAPLPPPPPAPPPRPTSGGNETPPAGSRPGPKPDEWLSPTKNPW